MIYIVVHLIIILTVHNLQGVSACVSAGFTTASITEPDTSVTGTDISPIAAGWPKGGACSPRGQSGCGSVGKFTVPSGVSSVSVYAWGAGGSKFNGCGGGGGYATGTLAVTAAQAFDIVVGEAGHPQTSICTPYFSWTRYAKFRWWRFRC